MVPLVEAYGAKRVWDIGTRELGFPPTWCESYSQMKKVEARLFLSGKELEKGI
jgi:hypothetical protein